MGETVEALAQKTDVASRGREAVARVRGTARATLTDVRDRLGERPLQVRLAMATTIIAAAGLGGAGGMRGLRERRRSRLTRPARKLPEPIRDLAMPAAQRSDRWMTEIAGLLRTARRTAGDAIDERRRRAMQEMSEQIARSLAEEQQRRNPLWLRIPRDAATSAATTAATLAVRRALDVRRGPGVAIVGG